MALTVVGVLETMEGLELIVQGKSRTITAVIPQEVAEPDANHFKATLLNKETLKVVYRHGSEKKVYEAQIRS